MAGEQLNQSVQKTTAVEIRTACTVRHTMSIPFPIKLKIMLESGHYKKCILYMCTCNMCMLRT